MDNPATTNLLNEDNFPTKILLANETAATNTKQREFYSKIGCNDKQIEIVANLAPAEEAYFQNPLGARRFSIHLGLVGRALCGRTDPADLMLCDQIAAITANDGPDAFLKHWLHATVPTSWAIEAVGPLDEDPDITLAAE
jgi:type IV secretion system protein VirB4